MSVPNVLLTGVTGFLGGATAAELLLRHPGCNLLLLVRGDNGAARVRLSLARFMAADLLESALARCTLIHGDVTDPAAWATPLLDRVTHVIHLAANTSFRSVRSVRLVNIVGTMAAAHRMSRVRGLQRFLYVGTAYICGPNTPPVVHEDDYPRLNVRHLVEYTASKAECEMLLEQMAAEIQLVVARPSVVVGHTRLGCLPSASIFWYYRTVDLLRRIPSALESRRDIVPVDFVAEALVWLLFKPELSHKRYHISSGLAGSVSWEEIAAAFANCQGATLRETYRVVGFATLVRERGRLQELLGPGDDVRLMEALEGYFRFGASRVGVFDNHRLLEEGMRPPPRFTDYLHTCAAMPADRTVYEQMMDDL